MFKFRYGILTVATIAAAIVPARAQQSATPPAPAAQADSDNRWRHPAPQLTS